jgi:hypothetical protein
MSSKVGEYIRAHVLGLLAILIALSGTAVAGQRTTSGDGPKPRRASSPTPNSRS